MSKEIAEAIQDDTELVEMIRHLDDVEMMYEVRRLYTMIETGVDTTYPMKALFAEAVIKWIDAAGERCLDV